MRFKQAQEPKEEEKQSKPIKEKIDRYKPKNIRSEAENDYQTYKETGDWPQRDPAVVSRTIRLLIAVVIIFLILGILLLVQAIGG
ncbi:hypothetical protein AB0Y39_05230 [Weissella paramesenteroides]|uniref:hypothetical protein n=1 Tax=Weissella paramesenteroides TaxID=1249 RepID=UPI002590CFCD|nr:hypothetical protein [uncultured Weissella sp.]